MVNRPVWEWSSFPSQGDPGLKGGPGLGQPDHPIILGSALRPAWRLHRLTDGKAHRQGRTPPGSPARSDASMPLAPRAALTSPTLGLERLDRVFVPGDLPLTARNAITRAYWMQFCAQHNGYAAPRHGKGTRRGRSPARQFNPVRRVDAHGFQQVRRDHAWAGEAESGLHPRGPSSRSHRNQTLRRAY